jgi:hypothetical protein
MFDRVTTRRASISGLLACAGLSACAPVFSDLQSARLVGRDRVEVTASASRVSVSSEELDDGDDIDVTDQFGVQVATGLTDWMDARLRFERVELKDAGGDEVGGVNVLGLGPKFQIVKDRVAAYLPVGLAFGEDVDASETWQFHPTLLLTLPAQPERGNERVGEMPDSAAGRVGQRCGVQLRAGPGPARVLGHPARGGLPHQSRGVRPLHPFQPGRIVPRPLTSG